MAKLHFLSQWLYSQLVVAPPYPTHDFTGQTVIVTGSNTGLGLEGAPHFAPLNCAKLVLAVRTLSKGRQSQRVHPRVDETHLRLHRGMEPRSLKYGVGEGVCD
jgi:NAD(P)-dependent dehydrogenase (short-subunit alcohol dehydrogenase family)